MEFSSPGHCRKGLCNNSPVTRSPCGCDKAFVKCLKEAKTRVANALGKFFFNVAGLTCYKFDYPIKVRSLFLTTLGIQFCAVMLLSFNVRSFSRSSGGTLGDHILL